MRVACLRETFGKITCRPSVNGPITPLTVHLLSVCSRTEIIFNLSRGKQFVSSTYEVWWPSGECARPDRAVLCCVLGQGPFLMSARYSHSASLHPGVQWIPANFMLGEALRCTCCRNRDKLRPDETLSSYADVYLYLGISVFTLTYSQETSIRVLKYVPAGARSCTEPAAAPEPTEGDTQTL